MIDGKLDYPYFMRFSAALGMILSGFCNMYIIYMHESYIFNSATCYIRAYTRARHTLLADE